MKYLLILSLLSVGFSANAQNGTKYLNLQGGTGIREIRMGSLGYGYNTKYHHRHEIFAEFMETGGTGYQTLMGGFAVKPVLARGGNVILRLRLGAGIGTDFRKAVAAPQVGWEFSRILKNRMELSLGNRNQAVLWAPESKRWRFVLDLGLRIPLN